MEITERLRPIGHGHQSPHQQQSTGAMDTADMAWLIPRQLGGRHGPTEDFTINVLHASSEYFVRAYVHMLRGIEDCNLKLRFPCVAYDLECR